MPAWALRHLAKAAGEQQYQSQEVILHQHDFADSVFFLLSGTIKIFIRFEGARKILMLGQLCRFGDIIGWSAFRKPYRHTATVRCEEASTVLRLPRCAFDEIFRKDPGLGYVFLKKIAQALASRLGQTRDILVRAPADTLAKDTGKNLMS